MQALLIAFVLLSSAEATSYIPPYIEGVPDRGSVTDIAPPDLRQDILFRIEHQVMTSEAVLQNALVHRTYQEFATLDKLFRDDFWLPSPPTSLPTSEEATVDSLDNYLQQVYNMEALRSTWPMSSLDLTAVCLPFFKK